MSASTVPPPRGRWQRRQDGRTTEWRFGAWRFAERPRLRPSIIGDLAALATARDYPVMRSTRQRSDQPGMPDTRRWSSAATISATVTESGDVTASYVTRSPLVRPKPLPQTVGSPRPALPNGHCEGLPTRPHIAMPLTAPQRSRRKEWRAELSAGAGDQPSGASRSPKHRRPVGRRLNSNGGKVETS